MKYGPGQRGPRENPGGPKGTTMDSKEVSRASQGSLCMWAIQGTGPWRLPGRSQLLGVLGEGRGGLSAPSQTSMFYVMWPRSYKKVKGREIGGKERLTIFTIFRNNPYPS